jgi:hypothetical protein
MNFNMKSRFEKAVQSYVTPEVEVSEVLIEGVLCASTAEPNEGLEWGEGQG